MQVFFLFLTFDTGKLRLLNVLRGNYALLMAFPYSQLLYCEFPELGNISQLG